MSAFSPHCVINLAKGDFDRRLYRIISIERALELIETKENVLVHPSLWDDPFENFILNSTYTTSDGELFTLAFRDHIFGQCWTVHPESDAMWRIYSADKNGVRIRTTMRNLFSGLRSSQNTFQDISCFIGKVSYHPQRQLERIFNSVSDPAVYPSVLDSTGYNQARSLLFKRKEFRHEHEARLIYLMPDPPRNPTRLFRYPFDPSIIDEITFDPRMSDRMCGVYEQHLSRLLPTAAINQSSLYRPPKSVLRQA